MSEVKHSETPWSVGQSAPGFTDIMRYGGKILVATAYECGQQHKIDAAHLVHCVNSHDALVAEVERLRIERDGFRDEALRNSQISPTGDIGEDQWKAEILVRDRLDASCLISKLANLLYDDSHAAAREQKLLQYGGPIIQQIEDAAANKVAEIQRHPIYRAATRAALSDTTGGGE